MFELNSDHSTLELPATYEVMPTDESGPVASTSLRLIVIFYCFKKLNLTMFVNINFLFESGGVGAHRYISVVDEEVYFLKKIFFNYYLLK